MRLDAGLFGSIELKTIKGFQYYYLRWQDPANDKKRSTYLGKTWDKAKAKLAELVAIRSVWSRWTKVIINMQRRYKFQFPIRLHLSRGFDSIYIGVSLRLPWQKIKHQESISIFLTFMDDD